MIVRAECRLHVKKTLFDVTISEFFVLLDQWIDHIDLSAELELSSHGTDQSLPLIVIAMQGLDRLTSRRQLVDDRNVEVAIDGHRQGARYGRCCHHEHVRRLGILEPQLRALLHAKAVLLIDHDHSEVLELHIGLYQGMCAYEDVQLPVFEQLMYLLSLFLGCRTRQQSHVDAHTQERFCKVLIMLCGENLGRGHEASLKAIVECHEHGQCRHHGLAAAHIALKQAVHLFACGDIGSYLAQDPFLGIGQLKRQETVVIVEIIGNALKLITFERILTHLERANQIELKVEQLLELQAHLCLAEIVGIGREMDLTDGLIIAHQLETIDHIRRECLGKGYGVLLKIAKDDLLDSLRIEICPLHPFGRVVHSHQTCHFLAVGSRYLKVGMGNVDRIVELLRLTEKQVFLAPLHGVEHVLDALEPHTIDRACAIGKRAYEAMSSSALSFLLKHCETALQEDVGHRAVNLANGVYLGLIDIPVREIGQQILIGTDVQFRLQNLCPLGAYTRDVL